MYLPRLAESCSLSIESHPVAVAASLLPAPGVVPSGGKGGGGGGGGGPTPPTTGVCARSCYDCTRVGYRGCSYNQWCANMYPGAGGTTALPYGCTA